jgi:RNA polymerase sigma-70 factor, ECF subfamily
MSENREPPPRAESPAPDDAELLRRFRHKERAAFDLLYDRYAGRVLAFAVQLTGSRADGEDLTQETFLAAFRSAGSFRGDARLLTWLLAIAVRRHRDARRRPRLFQAELREGTDAPDRPAGASSVESAALSSVAFRDAVGGLDENLREVFLLVAAQGLTQAEAATVLGIPLGTVKWRAAEATKRLRAALADDIQEKVSDANARTFPAR